MPNDLNIPSEETFVRVAEAMEKLADTRTVYDFTNSPGPKVLAKGDRDAGFFGFVPASDLITGDDLALDLGLTAGASIFSDSPWIKYIFKGQIKFIPLK